MAGRTLLAAVRRLTAVRALTVRVTRVDSPPPVAVIVHRPCGSPQTRKVPLLAAFTVRRAVPLMAVTLPATGRPRELRSRPELQIWAGRVVCTAVVGRAAASAAVWPSVGRTPVTAAVVGRAAVAVVVGRVVVVVVVVVTLALVVVALLTCWVVGRGTDRMLRVSAVFRLTEKACGAGADSLTGASVAWYVPRATPLSRQRPVTVRQL